MVAPQNTEKASPRKESPETTILRHLVLYGTYRITPEAPETALIHGVYQELQQDGILLENPILQQLLETTYQAHQDWLKDIEKDTPKDTAKDTEKAFHPYTLISYLQCHPDPKISTCATRIYNQQLSHESAYGEDAHPTTHEVLEIMKIQVLYLKKGIIEAHIKKLSQSIYDALEQDDIEKYTVLTQEKREWMERLRVAWGKM